MKEEKEQYEVPQWLKDLQENSWELELLISGGAIFSLFHLSDVLLETIDAVRITSPLPGLNLVLILGMIGIKVLTLGFVLHLLLRSYWLAMVCVNYIYPRGIKRDEINWKKPFNVDPGERLDLYNSIMKVDRVSGWVIFMSISATFLLAGWILLIFTMLTLPTMIGNGIFNTSIAFTPAFEFYFDLFLASFIVYVIDTLIFGLLRKIPILSYIVFPFFRLFDIISLRSLFQKPLWVFNTNIRKKQWMAAASIFLFVAVTFAYLNLYRRLHWPNPMDSRLYKWELAENYTGYSFYKDELDGEKVRVCVIPSKVISSNFLEVFLIYRKEFDDLIQVNNKNSSAKYFSEIAELSIDGKVYEDIEWYGKWNKDIDQMGIMAMVPIELLENGKHVLTLTSNVKFDNAAQQEELDRKGKLTIPFWKDVH